LLLEGLAVCQDLQLVLQTQITLRARKNTPAGCHIAMEQGGALQVM
jgi:hypothetical protein